MIQKGSISSDLIIDLQEYNIYENTKIANGIYGDIVKASRPIPGKDEISYFAIQRYKEILTTKDLKKFLNKIELQSVLKHIAILPLIGYSFPIKTYNYYAVVTPFIHNGNLSEFIGKFHDGLVLETYETKRAIITFGIAAGMAYMHQNGVIHQDLKPDNILLDDEFYPKIANFNSSQFVIENIESNIDEADIVFGTSDYIAPEIYKKEGISNKNDIYSYGIILYELWTKQKAFLQYKHLNLHEFGEIVKSGKKSEFKVDEIPNIIQELIEKCWNDDPNIRPNFIQIVRDFMERKEKYFDDEYIDKVELNDYIRKTIRGIFFFDSDDFTCHFCGKRADIMCNQCFRPYCMHCDIGHKCDMLINMLKS